MVNLLPAVSTMSDSQTASTSTAAPPNSIAQATATAAAVAQATSQQTQVSKEPPLAEVKQAAQQLETFMQSMNRYLEFRVDQDSGRTIVTVKDKTTGETVRQIPSEEILRLAQNLGGKAHTALISQAV